MADLQKVVKLTSSQYSTLAGGGTVGSYTGLDSSYLYLVEDSTQYIPLGGTTSLYGSIVPSTTNSYNLGTSLKRFKSVYASNIHASNASISNASIGTLTASQANISVANISSVAFASTIVYPGSMNIIANPAYVGQTNGGYLNMAAGSGISMNTTGGNIEMRASSWTYIYGKDVVKLTAGAGLDTYSYLGPMISLCLSGGYDPIIDIYASYSGYGIINLSAPERIALYANSSSGAIYTGCQSGWFRHNNHPVVTGWQHNVLVTHADQGTNTYAGYAFTLQLILPTSSAFTDLDTLASTIYDMGFVFSTVVSTAKVYPACGFMNLGSASTSAGAYHRHIIGVVAWGTQLRPAIVRPVAGSRITYGFDAALDGKAYSNPASVYDTVIALQ